jgi:hypothetical protein
MFRALVWFILAMTLAAVIGCRTVVPGAAVSPERLYKQGLEYQLTDPLEPAAEVRAVAREQLNLREVSTPKMQVQLMLTGIEVLANTVLDPDDTLELRIYASCQEVSGVSKGEVSSTVEPQTTPYFRIRKTGLQDSFAVSGPEHKSIELFSSPQVLTGKMLELSFHLVEVDGVVSTSTRERVDTVYEKFGETTNLRVKADVVEKALTTPWLSYVPIVYSCWELLLSGANVVNPDDFITDSPFMLTLDHSKAFRPVGEGVADEDVKLAVNMEGVQETVECPGGVCPREGIVTAVRWVCRTQKIEYYAGGGFRLYLTVIARPLREEAAQ